MEYDKSVMMMNLSMLVMVGGILVIFEGNDGLFVVWLSLIKFFGMCVVLDLMYVFWFVSM